MKIEANLIFFYSGEAWMITGSERCRVFITSSLTTLVAVAVKATTAILGRNALASPMLLNFSLKAFAFLDALPLYIKRYKCIINKKARL